MTERNIEEILGGLERKRWLIDAATLYAATLNPHCHMDLVQWEDTEELAKIRIELISNITEVLDDMDNNSRRNNSLAFRIWSWIIRWRRILGRNY